MRSMIFLAAALSAASLRAQDAQSISTTTALSATPDLVTVSSTPAAAPAAPEPESNVTVDKITFAVDVSSRMPVGESDAFDASAGSVYCWNQLTIGRTPARVQHVWYHDGRKVGELTILSRFHHMRIWSKHGIRPGQWRVEIKDAETGETVAVGAFLVRGGSSPAQAPSDKPSIPPAQ